jgi:minor extracellular protease Epr
VKFTEEKKSRNRRKEKSKGLAKMKKMNPLIGGAIVALTVLGASADVSHAQYASGVSLDYVTDTSISFKKDSSLNSFSISAIYDVDTGLELKGLDSMGTGGYYWTVAGLQPNKRYQFLINTYNVKQDFNTYYSTSATLPSPPVAAPFTGTFTLSKDSYLTGVYPNYYYATAMGINVKWDPTLYPTITLNNYGKGNVDYTVSRSFPIGAAITKDTGEILWDSRATDVSKGTFYGTDKNYNENSVYSLKLTYGSGLEESHTAFIPDVTPPSRPFIGIDTSATASKVTISISYPSDAIVKEYKIGASGTWTPYTAPFIMTANDTVFARGADKAGNVSEEDSRVVSNIDNIPPVAATLVANTTTPTNGNVTVTINYPTDASTKQYKVGASGTWTTYTAPVVLTANDTVYARSMDAAGNTSVESNLVVSNIDKTPPVAATLVADKTTPTNGNVNVTIGYPTDAVTKQYKIGSGGAWTTYTAPVVVTANDTVYARSVDAAGNTSTESSLVVSNIDKTPPVAATLVADKTTPTNGNVNVTIGYPTDAVTKQYKIGSGGAWTTYTAPVVVTANDTVYARSVDAAGNTSTESSLVVSNIDKTPPVAATFVADKTAPTNGNVTVTITYPSDAVTKQYKVGTSGAWTTYTAPVVLTANETIYARSTDAVGNTSAESNLVVNNIDKTAPVVATFVADKTTPTNGNVNVTINYPTDGVTKQYKIGSGGTWTAYTTPVAVAANNTIYARSTDAAGNTSAESSFVVNNIDKTPPTQPTASVTGNKLTITPGTDTSGIQSTQYQLNNGTWTVYSSVVTLPDGSYTIKVKSIDTVGNESATTTISATVIVESLDLATKAVQAAEANPTQSKVDAAQGLINSLPTSTDKTALQNRLNIVQANITLYNAIQTETTNMNTVVDKGNVKKETITQYKKRVDELLVQVATLPATMDKATLKKQLDDLKSKLILIDSLLDLKNDGDFTDVDLGDLEDEINKLPDGDLKEELKDQLEDAKNLQDAKDKVEKAESTKKQEDVDTARDAVNKVPDGQIKDDLNDRLDLVQKEIDDAKKLADLIADATSKVEKAELSKSQTDVNTARDAVNKLPNGQIKDNLNSRLDAVQRDIDAIVDATQKVVTAEKSKKQSDVDTARAAVNKLPNGQAKTDLTTRLDAVQKAIDDAKALAALIADATQKVVTAEGAKTQANVDVARVAVNKLPEGSVKTDLTTRLDAVQKAIDDAKALAALIADATQKVVTAEGSKTQANVDVAKVAVNKLPEGSVKTDLTTRLNAVQKAIDDEKALAALIADATQKVVTAEGAKTQANVDTARVAVNKLPNGQVKTDLTTRLDVVQKAIDDAKALAALIADATQKVVTAEGAKTQANVDVAKVAVNKLPEGSVKTDLTTRLDAVQKAIDDEKALAALIADATQKVVTAEGAKTQANVDTARVAVNKLPNGQVKTDLTTRLDAVQKAIDDEKALAALIADATQKVVTAEKSKTQSDVDTARVAVNKLPNGQVKTDLTTRLDAVQKAIDDEKALAALIADATQKVVTAEKSKTQADVDTARVAVNKLPNGQVKTDLSTRLDTVQKAIDDAKALAALIADATQKVVTAEKSKTQADVDTARVAVNKLPNGQVKTDLTTRLDVVQKGIDDAKALAALIADATQKVVTAEKSKTQADVDTARVAVNKLPNGQVKTDLTTRLDVVQKGIDDANALAALIADATQKVVTAEKSKTQADVDTARVAVNKLPDGQVKTDLNKRLDAIQKDIDDAILNPIEKAVKQAEKSKTQLDVNTARDLVNTLPNGSEKESYHKRLDAVDAALKAATTKVGQAESYLRDPYLSDAQKLVDALRESPAKVALQNRLIAIKQTIIDKEYQDLLSKAIQKVEQAEKYQREPYIQNAYDAVNALPNGKDKTGLLERLDAIGKATNPGNDKDGNFNPGDNIVDVADSIKDPVAKKLYLDWAKAVERAEKYFSKGNIVIALDKMDAIPTEMKDNSKYNALYIEMQGRSDTLKTVYNQMIADQNLEKEVNSAIKAVESYETYRTAYFKEKAQAAVDVLTNVEVKTLLQSQIDAVIEKQ